MDILVALSGGVDSSVAAALLLEEGHRLAAVTLKTFCYADIGGGPKSCCGLEGIESARAVASQLNIPHMVFDVSDRFKKEVIENFTREYEAGRTPNPCVICNATVKIPDLLERGKSLGFSHIATGHYAKCLSTPNGVGLFRGDDRKKDQAYFLWALPRQVLNKLILPLGRLTKSEVRDLARKFNLPSAEKPESQEICFVPGGDYVSFLQKLLPHNHPGFVPGDIRDTAGKILSRHNGYISFTVGQRKGLGGGHGRKLFVTEIRPETREIIVGESDNLLKSELWVDGMNILAPKEYFSKSMEILIRHRGKPIKAELVNHDRLWHFALKSEARAITPGQSAVFYSGDRVLGGGVIINKPL